MSPRAFAFDRRFDGVEPQTPFDAPLTDQSDTPFEPLFAVANLGHDGDEDVFTPVAFVNTHGAETDLDYGSDEAPPPPPGDNEAVLSEFDAAPRALDDEPFDAAGAPAAGDDLIDVFQDGGDLAAPAAPDPAQEQAIRDEAFAEGERQGYDRGRVDAEAAAMASLEARTIQALEAVAAAVPDARGQIDALLERVERRASRLAFAVVRKLAPALEAGVARETATRLMAEALKAAGAAPYLVVEASPDLTEMLDARLDDLRAMTGSRAEIELRNAEDGATGALRVLWETGGVEYDVTGASSLMADLIARAEEATAGSVWEAA